MNEAERIGELNAVMVIPRPLDELEETLPVASIWLEEREPLRFPVNIKENIKEAEIAQLPDLSKLSIKVTEEL